MTADRRLRRRDDFFRDLRAGLSCGGGSTSGIGGSISAGSMAATASTSTLLTSASKGGTGNVSGVAVIGSSGGRGSIFSVGNHSIVSVIRVLFVDGTQTRWHR